MTNGILSVFFSWNMMLAQLWLLFAMANQNLQAIIAG